MARKRTRHSWPGGHALGPGDVKTGGFFRGLETLIFQRPAVVARHSTICHSAGAARLKSNSRSSSAASVRLPWICCCRSSSVSTRLDVTLVRTGGRVKRAANRHCACGA